jgi:hypothetical protein
MDNQLFDEDARRRRIWRIAISGVALLIIVVASAVLLLRRSKQTNQTGLSESSLIDTPSEAEPPLQKCTLFFFDPKSRALAAEERRMRLSTDVTERLKQIITALLEDSLSGLARTIPDGVSLHEAYVDKHSTAYLDFSRHLKTRHIGGVDAEILTVKSILRTVQANFPKEIKKAQILIEGLEADTLAGHLDISGPFILSPELASEFP